MAAPLLLCLFHMSSCSVIKWRL
uniref:Uncharacterized protein n=1 Tax=Anguilla anguilla TaxID=7936 RepID=A0A0E9TCP2_ANGAN